MAKRKVQSISGDKTICLPMPPDVEDQVFVEDSASYRAYLDRLVEKQTELFPAEIIGGYCFHGFDESDKLRLRARRIRFKRNRQVYQLRPDTVMPLYDWSYRSGQKRAIPTSLRGKSTSGSGAQSSRVNRFKNYTTKFIHKRLNQELSWLHKGER